MSALSPPPRTAPRHQAAAAIFTSCGKFSDADAARDWWSRADSRQTSTLEKFTPSRRTAGFVAFAFLMVMFACCPFEDAVILAVLTLAAYVVVELHVADSLVPLVVDAVGATLRFIATNAVRLFLALVGFSTVVITLFFTKLPQLSTTESVQVLAALKLQSQVNEDLFQPSWINLGWSVLSTAPQAALLALRVGSHYVAAATGSPLAAAASIALAPITGRLG